MSASSSSNERVTSKKYTRLKYFELRWIPLMISSTLFAAFRKLIDIFRIVKLIMFHASAQFDQSTKNPFRWNIVYKKAVICLNRKHSWCRQIFESVFRQRFRLFWSTAIRILERCSWQNIFWSVLTLRREFHCFVYWKNSVEFFLRL